MYAFPKIEHDIEGLEKVYDDFKERGVQIKEMQEFLETKPKKEKKAITTENTEGTEKKWASLQDFEKPTHGGAEDRRGKERRS